MPADIHTLTHEVRIQWLDGVHPGDQVKFRYYDGNHSSDVAGVVGSISHSPNLKLNVVLRGRMQIFSFHATSPLTRIETVKCACGQPAQYLCSRNDWKYVQCQAGQLKVGDRTCRTGENSPKPGSWCVIESIEEPTRGTLVWPGDVFKLILRISRVGKKDRLKPIEMFRNSTLRRAENVQCRAAVCEACAQDPADDKNRWCPEHWSIRILESAAA